MSTFTIEIEDQGLRAALKALQGRVDNMQPVMADLGEKLLERTKHRFETSTGPDGAAWKPNSPATLALLASGLGKSYRKNSGALNKRGQARIDEKKPLIGATRQLGKQIVYSATGNRLTVSTTAVTAAYAAIQQFGGQAGRGRKVTIPARPFMPVTQGGSIYPEEQAMILETINAYLQDALD
ncbi:MAG: phage virion morphogenesis protein [Tibeticola sp.]